MPNTQTENSELEHLVGKYLTFVLRETSYAVAISKVREIIHVPDVTRVPRTHECIRGVMNLRGKIVSVLDLRTVLNMDLEEDTDLSRIIVLEIDGVEVGFVVDRVCAVLNITNEQIKPAPEFGSGAETEYVLGIGDIDEGVSILLDLDTALDARIGRSFRLSK